MRTLTRIAAEGWLVVLLVLAWWFGSLSSTSLFFPPLKTILEAFRDTWLFEQWDADVVPSLIRFGAGYAVAVAVGLVAGVVISHSRLLLGGSRWLIAFFQSLPGVALIPAALVVLGVGDTMKIAIIAAGAVWPVLLNTIDGVRSVDPELLSMSRVYQFRPTDRLFQVVLPSASPQIFAGMRTSLSIALILMVTSEMVASSNGIGYFVLQSQQTFAIPEMWSGILLLGLFGYLVNALFVLLESRILAWHHGQQGAQS